MLQFQPPGFSQAVLTTSLGTMVYYTPSPVSGGTTPAVSSNLPPLVFLHSLGGGSSAYEWSKVYPAFTTEYQVLAPDLIGWGQSTHPVRDYRVGDYLAMLAEFIETSASAPVTAIASSLTAGIVVRLAIQRPDLVRSLFLVAPSGFSDFGADYSHGLSAQVARLPGVDHLLYQAGAANAVAIRNFMAQFLFAQRDRITPEMVNAYLASAQQVNGEYAALASLRGDLCFDLSLYIGQLQVPTTLVWGEDAWFSRVEVGQRLAALNPYAIKRFHKIPDTGVLPHLELPAVVGGLLQQHLQQCCMEVL